MSKRTWDEAVEKDVDNLADELGKECQSGSLHDLSSFRDKIRRLTSKVIAERHLLHWLCDNPNVTLEAVECLLEACPASEAIHPAEIPSIDDPTIGLRPPSPLHLACSNSRCPSAIIELLANKDRSVLEYEADVPRPNDGGRKIFGYENRGTPLRFYLARGAGIDLGVIKLFLSLCPGALATPSKEGSLPLHYFCDHDGERDEENSLEVLSFLVNECPEAVRRLDRAGDTVGFLPLHHAVSREGPEFCKILVERYPESLTVRTSTNFFTGEDLPIDIACCDGSLRTFKYLYEIHPEKFDMKHPQDVLPIHLAARRSTEGESELVRFILAKDPASASKRTSARNNRLAFEDSLPLHMACCWVAPNMDAVRLIYDAYPEAIDAHDGEGEIPVDKIAMDREGWSQEALMAKAFLETQLEYALKARDGLAMATADVNGWLPLHRALRSKAPLGSIKLLVKGNPSALQASGPNGVLSMHLACAFGTVDVVQFLLECHGTSLDVPDERNNYPLHYACRRGNCEVVQYLLEKQSPAILLRDSYNRLPIQSFCESLECDKSSAKHTETIWRLLLACPEEIVTNMRTG